ncbi:ribosomal RNA-processing protein 8 [Cimex lectularius]|uniref:Ribosomal RNA-processing protein 8 n=1 Tax=Cimex lectularius TaxID=79782 RepID=A0A8I6RP34_CIMLE|nr:ribosomal RNA-processing protein 8 [Cimex lectularius]XP_024082906.1 ribosomal RNA-processing protein 8 [Cimex lectularius]
MTGKKKDIKVKKPSILNPVSSRSKKVAREKFKNSKLTNLREKMIGRLSAAKFRFINQQLYEAEHRKSNDVFNDGGESFKDYHAGFRHQVKHWPINPIDVIIRSIKKLKDLDKMVIADFGCGEAKLASELPTAKVFSLDLVALNDKVIECDMSSTNLYSSSIDIAVYCLSLMGKELSPYIKEANRVLKIGGLLKIAEVESRFDKIEEFILLMKKYGFDLISKDLSHNLFYFLNFKKISDISKSQKKKLPCIQLAPCMYKKR